MTPAARVAAAIEILDHILAGAASEQTLTRWGRSNRFAGSKDRAAIRDHVFDGLRNLSRYAALGGAADAPTGRAVMLGAVWASGAQPADIFTGLRHAPEALSPSERLPGVIPDASEWNLPPWLITKFQLELGPNAMDQARALSQRAPVSIRVNLNEIPREELAAQLETDGFSVRVNPLCATALTLEGTPRGVTQNAKYTNGLFEMQDAASQAVVAALPDTPRPRRILDYCAGGGGKTLALAAKYTAAKIVAHDKAADRMRDLPARAARAGVDVHTVSTIAPDTSGAFDLVLLDVPCSGSGSWRRAPEAKWRLTPEKLEDLRREQSKILETGSAYVAPGGTLAYATCSILTSENQAQVDQFLATRPGWSLRDTHTWPITADGDGFYLAVLVAPPSDAV